MSLINLLNRKIKKYIIAIIVFTVLFVAIGYVVIGYIARTSDAEMNNLEIQADNIDIREKIKLAEIIKQTIPRAQQVNNTDLITQLKKEIESINNFNSNRYKNSIENIRLEVVLFSNWARLNNEAKKYKNSEINNIGKELEKGLAQLQTREFPIMREAYRNLINDKNTDINIYGSYTGIIEFVGKIFDDTANVAKKQAEISDIVWLLRFKGVKYKSNRYSDESVYYNMQSRMDSELIAAD